VFAYVLTQAAPTEYGWLDSLGAFVAFGALAMLVIWWLARQNQQKDTAIREMSDRLVEQAEKAIPVLERCASAMEQATNELRRRR